MRALETLQAHLPINCCHQDLFNSGHFLQKVPITLVFPETLRNTRRICEKSRNNNKESQLFPSRKNHKESNSLHREKITKSHNSLHRKRITKSQNSFQKNKVQNLFVFIFVLPKNTYSLINIDNIKIYVHFKTFLALTPMPKYWLPQGGY
jgi:hypothetical protein